MARAEIRIDQTSNPVPTGTPGKARDDIIAGAAVLLRNADDNGVTSHFWDLLDKPVGSATVIANPTNAVATLTPDGPGTYRVYLRVNDGRNRRGREDFTDVIVRDAAGFRAPAYNEGVESDFAIGGGLFNAVGPLHEYRRRMYSNDNRDGPYLVAALGAGASLDFDIDWPLHDAVLVWMEVRSTASTTTRVEVFSDAARTNQCFTSGIFDATLVNYRSNTPVVVSGVDGAAVEASKVYMRISNTDAVPSDYSLRWRFQAL